MARPPKPPDGTDHFEIQTEESTMERFASLARKVLAVSREEIRQKEKEFKAEQRKRRIAVPKLRSRDVSR